MTKQYIGISRDHSGSMSHIARHAARDYNANIATIREAAATHSVDTIVSVVKCGHGRQGIVHRDITNSNVTQLQPLLESAYEANAGSTPLFDSVGDLIEQFQAVPDYNDPDVSFLVMAVTDGQDNSSRRYSARSLAQKIKELQATDRWTFVFRVPRGDARALANMGIPESNILEWEQSQRGVEAATQATTQAFNEFFASRATGVRSTKKFYTNLKDVSTADVKAVLKDISAEVQLWPVAMSEDQQAIRTFVEGRLGGKPMLKGAAFYQLNKTEPTVQDYKLIAIRDKSNGAVYAGDHARDMLGLPKYGNCRLAPGDHGNFEIFIQSTSVNRKVTGGAQILYWANVGQAFKEGISAR